MISKKSLDFLKKLSKNNNRDWFNDNKPKFKEAYAEWTDFMYALADEIGKFDPNVKLNILDSKKTVKVFRIYRDIRFSKDKTPYKTYFSGAVWTDKRGEGSAPGYYIRVQPGNTIVGGGMHKMDSNALFNIRESFVKDDKPFRKIMNAAAFKKLYSGLEEWNMLKTVPRGFDKEGPALDLIRHKGYFVLHRLTDQEVLSKGFLKVAAKDLKPIKPFNDYLKQAANKKQS
jgi:uncharacterized protein (TIGR02453 family)